MKIYSNLFTNIPGIEFYNTNDIFKNLGLFHELYFLN